METQGRGRLAAEPKARHANHATRQFRDTKGSLPEFTIDLMADPERFRRPTPRFVVWCSIQLSYGSCREAVM